MMPDEFSCEHELTNENCWCHPTLLYEAPNGNQVWIHHYDDEPEYYPPADVLMEAIVIANFGEDSLEEESYDH